MKKNIYNDEKQIILALKTNYNKIFKDVFEQYAKQLCRYNNGEKILPKTFLGDDVRTLQIFFEAEIKLYTYHSFEKAVELFV